MQSEQSYGLSLYAKGDEPDAILACTKGQVKHVWQWVEIAALVSYLHPNDVEGDKIRICENPKLKHPVRHKVLQYKRDDVGLTEEERDEELYLSFCRVKKRLEFATKEVHKSGIQYRLFLCAEQAKIM